MHIYFVCTLCVFCATITHGGYNIMNKTISISIRVSEEELERLKTASKIEEYSSYSEFIRRTALLAANRIITKNGNDSSKEKTKNK